MTSRNHTAWDYQRSLDWIVGNGRQDWLDDPGATPSTEACLVADMYGRTDQEVRVDLIGARARLRENLKDIRSAVAKDPAP